VHVCDQAVKRWKNPNRCGISRGDAGGASALLCVAAIGAAEPGNSPCDNQRLAIADPARSFVLFAASWLILAVSQPAVRCHPGNPLKPLVGRTTRRA
jgi:hypothetical protein